MILESGFLLSKKIKLGDGKSLQRISGTISRLSSEDYDILDDNDYPSLLYTLESADRTTCKSVKFVNNLHLSLKVISAKSKQ